MQGVYNNFDIDVFQTIIRQVVAISGVPYVKDAKAGTPEADANVLTRRVADHVRAISFCIADGALPGNADRGYIVRRLIRRATLDIDKLGVNEEIQSVRWFDDLAIVVTFRQIDPLYTVDLSEPTAPALLGELKIPGFSAYLHPVGEDLLLGIGQDATERGETTGSQASTFDISDLSDPRRVTALGLGIHRYSTVEDDPRSFTFLAEQRIALVPVDGWGRDAARLTSAWTSSTSRPAATRRSQTSSGWKNAKRAAIGVPRNSLTCRTSSPMWKATKAEPPGARTRENPPNAVSTCARSKLTMA